MTAAPMVVPTIAPGPRPLPLLPVSLTDGDAVACDAASVICPESLLSADTVACAEVIVPAGIVILAAPVVCAKIDVCTTIYGCVGLTTRDGPSNRAALVIDNTLAPLRSWLGHRPC